MLGKRSINAFIAIYLILIFIDGMPSFNSVHDKLKGPVDKVVDYMGVSQGPWGLFAPWVDKENVRVEALITYSDGSTELWNSPNWSKMGPVEKFRTFRQAEYFDDIRMDWNHKAWEPLADYIAHVHPREDLQITSVLLVRAWTTIAAPGKPQEPEQHFHFYEKKYSP